MSRYHELINFVEREMPRALALGIMAPKAQARIMAVLHEMRHEPVNTERISTLGELLDGWRDHFPPDKAKEIDRLFGRL